MRLCFSFFFLFKEWWSGEECGCVCGVWVCVCGEECGRGLKTFNESWALVIPLVLILPPCFLPLEEEEKKEEEEDDGGGGGGGGGVNLLSEPLVCREA